MVVDVVVVRSWLVNVGAVVLLKSFVVIMFVVVGLCWGMYAVIVILFVGEFWRRVGMRFG